MADPTLPLRTTLPPARPRSSILYTSPTTRTILLDIPTSISLSFPPLSPSLPSPTLISSPPPLTPYPPLNFSKPSTKSTTTTTPPQSDPDTAAYHTELQSLIRTALEEITLHHSGPWCLPRTYPSSSTPSLPSSKKRKAHPAAKSLSPQPPPAAILPSSAPPAPPAPPSFSHGGLTIPSLTSLPPTPHQNPHPTPSLLTTETPKATYLIPPHSTFILATLPPSFTSFPIPANKNFALILLDPPWPNRSAARVSARAKRYARCRDIEETRELLMRIPVGTLLGEKGSGLVGMWVTNRASVRALVMEVFEYWGVELVEEWVWVKVTASGETVFRMEGEGDEGGEGEGKGKGGGGGRKPWEVLMIGQRRRKGSMGTGMNEDEREKREVKRRVIAAVPDVHSRKPGLSELVGGLIREYEGVGRVLGDGREGSGLSDGREGDENGEGDAEEKEEKEGRVLEIFARNLTRGWWAWGDECLKFQEWGKHLV